MTRADAKKHVCRHIAMNLAGEMTKTPGLPSNRTLMAWMLPPETPEADAERIHHAIDEIIKEMRRRGGIQEEKLK